MCCRKLSCLLLVDLVKSGRLYSSRSVSISPSSPTILYLCFRPNGGLVSTMSKLVGDELADAVDFRAGFRFGFQTFVDTVGRFSAFVTPADKLGLAGESSARKSVARCQHVARCGDVVQFARNKCYIEEHYQLTATRWEREQRCDSNALPRKPVGSGDVPVAWRSIPISAWRKSRGVGGLIVLAILR